MTHIALCSAHPMLAAGFCSLLQDVAGEFSASVCVDTNTLADHIRTSGARLVLADMSNGISLNVLNSLRATAPDARIILWVDGISVEFVSQALNLGVIAVLPKSAPLASYLDCLRHAALGKLWVENELSSKLLTTRRVHLTPRERQLTTLLAQGLRNKEIAFRLGITEGTVKVYLSKLYSKLGVSDRFDLALTTLRNLADEQSSASDDSGAGDTDFYMPAVISLPGNLQRIQQYA